MTLLTETLELWDRMLPEEQRRLVELLVQRVEAMPPGHCSPPTINVHFVESDGNGRPARN